jgi:proteasome lid subunit RPN8/RPN11
MSLTTTRRDSLVALGSALLAQLARHGEATYPNECCGLLAGRELNGVRVVERFVPVENRWGAGERSRRFLIEPEVLRTAERNARRDGLDIVGIYHSHPDAPARPSEFDREHAWPWYTYLIASIEGGRFATIRGWRLRDDRSGYVPLTIRLGLPHVSYHTGTPNLAR